MAGIAGVALLAEPEQSVITQEGASSGSPAPEAVDDDEARPVLDLAQSTTTLPSTTATVSSTTPTTTATTSTVVEPASTTVDVPTSTTTSDEGPAADQPVSDRWLTVDVGAAGTVDLRIEENLAEPGDVRPQPGWTSSVTRSPEGHLDVVFFDEVSQASLGVRSDPGRFVLEVDHGAAWLWGTEWTRTYSIGDGGTVEITYGSQGLSGLDVRLADGWGHRVDTIGPDHLLVYIVDPTMGGRWDASIEAGPVVVDLLITGS